MRFSGIYLSFRRFLASSSYLQIVRLSSINSVLNFWQNKPNFCRLNALVCCCALRVNETKLTSRNAFILDLFALGVEKRSRYDERTLFQVSLQKLDLFLNPQPPKHAHMRFFEIFQFQAANHYSEITCEKQSAFEG